jgi:hypothetical protein
MKELSVFSTSFINLMKLQHKWPPCNDTYRHKQSHHFLIPIAEKTLNNSAMKTRDTIISQLPEPRGKKSFPTTLSSTDDFPELYKKKQKL